MTDKSIDLGARGVLSAASISWNGSVAALYEDAVRGGEAVIAEHGPLVAETGSFTGRSPNDKFIVKDSTTDDVWWGDVNRAIDPSRFDGVFEKVRRYAASRHLYVFDGYAGADPRFRLPIRIVTERAWHSLFARNMFVREDDPARLVDFRPQAHVIDLPRRADR